MTQMKNYILLYIGGFLFPGVREGIMRYLTFTLYFEINNNQAI